MKNKLILITAISMLALPVLAQDPIVLTPTKLYDLIEELQKNQGADRVAFSHDDAEQRARIEALEKKVSHITKILKLKQEQGK